MRNKRTPLYLFILVSPLALAQSQSGSKSDSFAEFRPRKEMPKEAFVGRQVCAGCHGQKNHSQAQTAMAHALSAPQDSTVLQFHSKLTFHAGAYTFEITTDGQQSIYSVTDGKLTVSEPIAYAFGKGHVAQTYVLRHNGKLYEGRVSYYSAIDGLDWTIGDALSAPPNVEEAFGRDISGDESRNCFSCHGTGAVVVDGKLQLESLTPGVTCEACHGPGRSHTEAMRTGTGDSLFIFDPRTLSPDTLSQEFCGACHRSANTVGMMPDLGGIVNVRFQPYRIATGKHDFNDPHFACTACHDPHIDLPLQRATSDSKCTACHIPDASTPKVSTGPEPVQHRVSKLCPVANENCERCHMPKVEIPGTHFKFTDHRIRIVRAGEKYPF